MLTNNYDYFLNQARYRQQELLREAMHNRLAAALRQETGNLNNNPGRSLWQHVVCSLAVMLRRSTARAAQVCCTTGRTAV